MGRTPPEADRVHALVLVPISNRDPASREKL